MVRHRRSVFQHDRARSVYVCVRVGDKGSVVFGVKEMGPMIPRKLFFSGVLLIWSKMLTRHCLKQVASTDDPIAAIELVYRDGMADHTNVNKHVEFLLW